MSDIVSVGPVFGKLFLKNDGSPINLKVDVDPLSPLKSGSFDFDTPTNKPLISGNLTFLPTGQNLGLDTALGFGILTVRVDVPVTSVSKKFTVTVTLAGGKMPCQIPAPGDGSAAGVVAIHYVFKIQFVLPAPETAPVVAPAAAIALPAPLLAPKPKKPRRRRKPAPPPELMPVPMH